MFLQISEQLKSLSTTLSVSSKRIKRSVLSHSVPKHELTVATASDASCVYMCTF